MATTLINGYTPAVPSRIEKTKSTKNYERLPELPKLEMLPRLTPVLETFKSEEQLVPIPVQTPNFHNSERAIPSLTKLPPQIPSLQQPQGTNSIQYEMISRDDRARLDRRERLTEQNKTSPDIYCPLLPKRPSYIPKRTQGSHH